jgi:hypothetical protein
VRKQNNQELRIGVADCEIQWGLGSRTIRVTNTFSEQKTSRMTNGFSDYEHASWQAESISAGVSCWLTLAKYTSLLDFRLRTFRFTNGLQERIKFVNRGPTVFWMLAFNQNSNLQKWKSSKESWSTNYYMCDMLQSWDVHTGFWFRDVTEIDYLGRPSRRWEDNIRMNLQQVQW